MSTATPDVLRHLATAPSSEAWEAILGNLWKVFSAPLPPASPETEIIHRERAISPVELALSGSAWDLWRDFSDVVPRASAALIDFWNTNPSGRAILILDGLSLREIPWLLQQVKDRGYKLHRAAPFGAELPSETTSFAKALGLPQRSALENDGAGASHALPKARTETTNVAWSASVSFVKSAPDVMLWHHWPDERIHHFSSSGEALKSLTREAQQHLTSDAFWSMIQTLTTGRRLVITSDHGYAASSLFSDVTDEAQKDWLKSTFSSGRFTKRTAPPQHWLPPLALDLPTTMGDHAFVLGRRKWKSAGGYPALVHGGLSLMETVVPLLELSQ